MSKGIRRLGFAFSCLSILSAVALLFLHGHFPASIPSDAPALDDQDFSTALNHVSATGLVDYAALKQDRAPLDRWVSALAATSPLNTPERFPTAEARLAFWLNAYNALALQSGLDGWPAPASEWTRQFHTWPIGGQRLSLQALERRFLKDTGDPRITFALACGALSCPRLDGAPFQEDTLDAQLTDAVRRFVQDKKNFRLEGKTAWVSVLLKHHEPALIDALPEHTGTLLHFVWAFLPDTCTERPGCDTRADLDRVCGIKLNQCETRLTPFDASLAMKP